MERGAFGSSKTTVANFTTYYGLSTRMALALKKVDIPLNKETKPSIIHICYSAAYHQFLFWYISSFWHNFALQLKEFQFFFISFSLLTMSNESNLSNLSLEISIQLFFPIFILYIPLVYSVFVNILRHFELLHLRNPQYCRVLFILFWTHIVCLCHYSKIRPHASTSIHCFFGPFVIVHLGSILRMI